MNNLQLQFISYKSINSKQLSGIATILIDQKFIINFAEKQNQKGGNFYPMATHYYEDEYGEKHNEKGFECNTVLENKQLEDFIRAHVNAEKRKASNPAPQAVHYPHGLCQPQQPQYTPAQASAIQADFFAGVGEAQEQIPF